MKKKTCQNSHARRRALERFGLNMGPVRHAKLVRDVQSGAARFVERQSNRVTVWDADLDGHTVRIIYDGSRKQIVTFLFTDGEPAARRTAP